MEWKYYKNYRYRSFYQKLFNLTKIIIQCKIPINQWVGISETEEIGNISKEITDTLAIKKIEEIENENTKHTWENFWKF